MWLYLGLSCPDHPFSEDLGDLKINTQIHKVLDHRADLNPGTAPAPLREGVDNTNVSPLRFIFGSLHNFIHSSHLCLCAGSRVCSQRDAGHQPARGCDEVGSKMCPQREVAGIETEKAGLEYNSYGCKGAGGGYPHRTLIVGRGGRRGCGSNSTSPISTAQDSSPIQ
jgi:hypothetical protein